MSVTIYEEPIKSAVNLEDQVTVYVPGYSYFGPEEPTLCSSVSEFESLFGTTPPLLKEADGTNKLAKDSPEKGYIYAKALLDLGLKVFFHRCKPDGAATASKEFSISYKPNKAGEAQTYNLKVLATSFGDYYNDIKVKFTKLDNLIYRLDIIKGEEEETILYSGNISLDPSNGLYFKTVSLPYITFKAGNGTDIEDSTMGIISASNEVKITGEEEGTVTLDLAGGSEGTKGFTVGDLIKGLANNMMDPLLDFERYPSVTYLTSGGYYLSEDPNGSSAAAKLISMAEKICSLALIDEDYEVNDTTTWKSAQTQLASLAGTKIAKGKAAHFVGCNSFNVAPYRLVLGDSFNYLTCLASNISRNRKDYLPVANDPNGVSPYGYDTTQRISTQLAEEISESEIGVASNAIIYSQSAGGYKIMGNRTLLANDGVLSPNSFLNVSVIVNKVERAARQAANKLKIASTDPDDTFKKFKISVSKTLDPLAAERDGLYSYTITHLVKTKPATIDIRIHLVVVEGIEKFNIYVPYEIRLD